MTLKSKLRAGDPLVGTFLKTPSPMICEVLGGSDLDLICLDAEHSPFDRRDIDGCIAACRAAGMPVIVRPQSASPEQILNALDCGADGILAPHIATVKAAEALVAAGTYGKARGYAGSSRSAGYGGRTMQQQIEASNASVSLIAQIEDAEALEGLDDLFAVEGLDAFFIGRADLTVSMGFDTPSHPAVVDAVAAICEAGQKAGRTVGMFTGNLDEIPKWRALGASLFLLGSDHSFMLQGAAQLYEDVQKRL